MVATTIAFGTALVLLGVGAYVLSGAASITALIPAFMGAIVLMLGLLARAKPALSRGLVIGAVALAVLAILGSARGVGGFIALLQGEEVLRPVAVVAQTLTLLLSVIYLVSMALQARSAGPASATASDRTTV
jgi:hypothetical protein